MVVLMKPCNHLWNIERAYDWTWNACFLQAALIKRFEQSDFFNMFEDVVWTKRFDGRDESEFCSLDSSGAFRCSRCTMDMRQMKRALASWNSNKRSTAIANSENEIPGRTAEFVPRPWTRSEYMRPYLSLFVLPFALFLTLSRSQYSRAEMIKLAPPWNIGTRKYIFCNRTHVVLSEGRRNWPITGFPFVGDADRLRRFLLHRFWLVEQRQLVKLLDICNSPKSVMSY